MINLRFIRFEQSECKASQFCVFVCLEDIKVSVNDFIIKAAAVSLRVSHD